MGISRTTFLALALLLSFSAEAAVTFVSAGGASKFTLASTAGSTTAVRARVLAGVVLNSGTSCGTTTCNTCETPPTATEIRPCNEVTVGPQTQLTLQGQTSAVGSLPANPVPFLKTASGSPINPVSQSAIDSAGNFTAVFNWSDVCGLIDSVGSGCTGSGTGTLQFGIGDSNGTEKVDIDFVVSVVDAGSSSFHTPCTGGSGGQSGEGYCEFLAYPGDGKIYAKDLSLAGGSISTSNGLKWAGLVFFYEASNPGGGSTTLAGLRTTAAHKTLSYDNTVVPPEVDNRVDGLENGTYYCFLMGNMDETGNISMFTPTSADEAQVCTTPSEVVGLLDDKKCFIATAAFGSPLEPHVKTLRLFRDRFLKTNAPGRAFVELYYEWSPTLANWIAEHDVARAAVRGVLAPLVAFAGLSLEYGVAPVSLLMIVALAGLAAVLRRGRRNA